MTLGTSESILVIILSLLLAIFLALSIAIAVLVIKVLKNVRHVTERAGQIADNAEAVSEFFKHTTGPMALGKLISNIYNAAKEHKERK